MTTRPSLQHDIEWTHDRISRIWDFYGQNIAYDDLYFTRTRGPHIIDQVKPYVSLQKKRILDFGCGPGFFIQHLLNHASGNTISGIDFSPVSVEKTNQKFSHQPQFERCLLVRDLPLKEKEDASSDTVFLIEVVEHLDDTTLNSTLKEIYRLLSPEGFIVVTTPNNENLNREKTMCPECGCVFHRWQHVRHWTPLSLKVRLEEAGFRTIAAHGTFFQSRIVRFAADIFYRFKKLPPHRPHLLYIGQK